MNIGKLYDAEEVRKLGGIVDYVVGTPLTRSTFLPSIRTPSSNAI